MTYLDVAVVGSGHNALVAAAYLAKAGRTVEVFERDTEFGGAVSTVERFPGHRVDRGSSAHIMVRHTGIVEELDLAAHGLRYLDLDPWAFAPAEPHTGEAPIVFYQDLARTCESIARTCGDHDAASYRRFVEVWAPRSARVMRAFTRPPKPGSLVRSFWGLDLGDGPNELSRQFLATGNSLLDEYFDSERLKAALAWFGAQSGPAMDEPGTAPMVGFAALMHTLPPGRAVGGSGALTKALISRIRSDGAAVTGGDAVVALRRNSAGWSVHTDAGRTIHARSVIAGCHILTTLDLLSEADVPADKLTQWRRGIRVGTGMGMVVRAATSGLPEYRNVAAASDSSTGLALLVTDRTHLAAAHGAAMAGQLPARPAVLAMSFSAIDSTLAPPGQHQLSLWAQWHPYRINGRTWDAAGSQAADAIVAEVDRYAPGFADLVIDRYVQTPDMLESELGLIGGNVMHIEMSLDQMMLFRPRPELSGYRVPGAPGLYLTGASTHPGGGVSGASGRNAAAVVLSDTSVLRPANWIRRWRG